MTTYSPAAASVIHAIAAAPITLHRLNKDGHPSKMHDAKSYHQAWNEALAVVTRVRGLNPGQTIRYCINGREV